MNELFVGVCRGVLGGVGSQVACKLVGEWPGCGRLLLVGSLCGVYFVSVCEEGRRRRCAGVWVMCGRGEMVWVFWVCWVSYGCMCAVVYGVSLR